MTENPIGIDHPGRKCNVFRSADPPAGPGQGSGGEAYTLTYMRCTHGSKRYIVHVRVPSATGPHPSPHTLPHVTVRALPVKPADRALGSGALASSPPLQTSPEAGEVARPGVERQAMCSRASYRERPNLTRSLRRSRRRSTSPAVRGCPLGVYGAPLTRRHAASTLSSIAEGLQPAGGIRRVYRHGPMGHCRRRGLEALSKTPAVVRMMINGTAKTLTSFGPCIPGLGIG